MITGLRSDPNLSIIITQPKREHELRGGEKRGGKAERAREQESKRERRANTHL
jgi:hypothetical protein